MREIRLEISPGVEKAAREDPEAAKAMAELAGDAVVKMVKEEAADNA